MRVPSPGLRMNVPDEFMDNDTEGRDEVEITGQHEESNIFPIERVFR